jgi:DNA (cytosine-5)-methyltransferase 1
MVTAGGTWRNDPSSVLDPMACRTTRENDGLAIPPLLIPVEGRDGKEPASANTPLRTQTARNETGLAWLPFMVTMRGGGDQLRGRSIEEPVGTVSANGNHHGLVTPENVDWQSLLVPYYGKGNARAVSEPIGTLMTRDKYALVQGEVDIDDVLFRMLEPHEIGRAMSFADAYIVLGSKRERVRQYGNAVTPNCAEVIVSALVEAITGEDIDRYTDGQFTVAA